MWFWNRPSTAFPPGSLFLAKRDGVLALLWAPHRKERAHSTLPCTFLGSPGMLLLDHDRQGHWSMWRQYIQALSVWKHRHGLLYTLWLCLCSNMGNRCACKKKGCISTKPKVCEKCIKQTPEGSCHLDPGTPPQHTSDALQRPQRLNQCLTFMEDIVRDPGYPSTNLPWQRFFFYDLQGISFYLSGELQAARPGQAWCHGTQIFYINKVLNLCLETGKGSLKQFKHY